jgi:hypothetical protein
LFHDPHGAATGSNNARGDHAGTPRRWGQTARR